MSVHMYIAAAIEVHNNKHTSAVKSRAKCPRKQDTKVSHMIVREYHNILMSYTVLNSLAAMPHIHLHGLNNIVVATFPMKGL